MACLKLQSGSLSNRVRRRLDAESCSAPMRASLERDLQPWVPAALEPASAAQEEQLHAIAARLQEQALQIQTVQAQLVVEKSQRHVVSNQMSAE